jgi:hypothetical protein
MFVKLWSEKLVCDRINGMYGNEPLNSHYVSSNHPDLYSAGCRLFGSWKDAVVAAGLDYTAIRKYKKWDKSDVMAAIRQRFDAHEPISCQFVQVNCRALYMAAIHKFGAWNSAVIAAGVDYNSIRQRRRLTVEEVREEIINLFESGENLAYPNMRKNFSYLLTYGIRKLGNGSWTQARLNCGIKKNYRKKRHLPDDFLEPELFPVDRSGF